MYVRPKNQLVSLYVLQITAIHLLPKCPKFEGSVPNVRDQRRSSRRAVESAAVPPFCIPLLLLLAGEGPQCSKSIGIRKYLLI